MNSVIISGRLTRKPELVQGQKPYTRFDLAVDRGRDKTDFINVTVFDKTAELVCEYCDKGIWVEVQGILANTRKDGKITGIGVIGSNVKWVNSARKTESEPKVETPPKKGDNTQIYSDFGDFVRVDDLPF